ncbi:MAG: MerR family transcriptional regulator [Sphaerotilus natans subsp. sulfidivorans]|uniref:MerR family transcriptional regulator n=1 Tax=Sphaerotilus sulfidivorans TaxID=639200 RepID=UPI0023558C63|nr:MerR family transcriptional regulator [Sphaerotilus sulfidivorans]MCK6401212.1 MerR family transcriptional regulator [Sphaerotilus sulfidivorans]
MENNLPAIPPKRYFTIGEVSELCGVKPHVLRYWEQEFAQLRPVKRRGNRRYYQRHEVLLVRRIRDLLYEQGFTISGARNRLAELGPGAIRALEDEQDLDEALAEAAAPPAVVGAEPEALPSPSALLLPPLPEPSDGPLTPQQLRAELLAIRALLG